VAILVEMLAPGVAVAGLLEGGTVCGYDQATR
jgi:hypothetical protein